jgi:pimeloyl-ACP methyl ester carboxylesterase
MDQDPMDPTLSGATRRELQAEAAVSAAPVLFEGAAGATEAQTARRAASDRRCQRPPLVIEDQGTFLVGGTVIRDPGTFDPTEFTSSAGGTLHGDHAYVQYQIPENAHRLPVVLLHGGGQFSKTWETTPDGREGYQNILLRRGWPVYILDQPRRGRAGQGTVGTTFSPTTNSGSLWQIFRLGLYPDFFPGTQFAANEEAVDQYWRQVTPDTGPEPMPVRTEPHPQVDGIAALFDKIGPAILISHSAGGRYSWLSRIKSDNVKAIVSYEPVGFTFPDDAPPVPVPGRTHPFVVGTVNPTTVTPAEFGKLIDIPIQIIYGDNIPRDPQAPHPYPGIDLWRAATYRGQQFVDEVNRRGGNASILHLPDIGVHGNTHFPFSDLNNLDIADLLSEFLGRQQLDRC